MNSAGKAACLLSVLALTQIGCLSARADLPLAPAIPQAASGRAVPSAQANSVLVPQQILRTGINLNSRKISANTAQLIESLNLAQTLNRMQDLRGKIGQRGGTLSLEGVGDRQELIELNQRAQNILVRTSLEVDFVLAEIDAEKNIYKEVLSSFQGSRDKLVARINAGSFILNGALWAVCEGLAIPTPHHPNYAIHSGIIGITAGIVPSIASGYALKAYSGKHKKSEVEPNMLAKIFDRPINEDIEYPKSVWTFLNSVPASENTDKSRKDQLIDRWISDKNIPSFTDRNAAAQIDVITATVARNKALSIDNLNIRLVMLEQLQGELSKMKRMLMEVAMVMTAEKDV